MRYSLYILGQIGVKEDFEYAVTLKGFKLQLFKLSKVMLTSICLNYQEVKAQKREVEQVSGLRHCLDNTLKLTLIFSIIAYSGITKHLLIKEI